MWVDCVTGLKEAAKKRPGLEAARGTEATGGTAERYMFLVEPEEITKVRGSNQVR